MEITRNTTIGDILDHDAGTAAYFQEMGMHCLGCPSARNESIEQACAVHGTDCNRLIGRLNRYLQSKPAMV